MSPRGSARAVITGNSSTCFDTTSSPKGQAPNKKRRSGRKRSAARVTHYQRGSCVAAGRREIAIAIGSLNGEPRRHVRRASLLTDKTCDLFACIDATPGRLAVQAAKRILSQPQRSDVHAFGEKVFVAQRASDGKNTSPWKDTFVCVATLFERVTEVLHQKKRWHIKCGVIHHKSTAAGNSLRDASTRRGLSAVLMTIGRRQLLDNLTAAAPLPCGNWRPRSFFWGLRVFGHGSMKPISAVALRQFSAAVWTILYAMLASQLACNAATLLMATVSS
jgi:hypothetical protein